MQGFLCDGAHPSCSGVERVVTHNPYNSQSAGINQHLGMQPQKLRNQKHPQALSYRYVWNFN